MVRIKAAVARLKGRKRVRRLVKGQFGRRKNNYVQSIKSLIKGMAYAYRDRKVKKREYRALWIVRVNAACREEGISYSRFMNGLLNANIVINRKVLADIAVTDPQGFSKLVEIAKASMSQPAAQPANA
jgi:large subunit ribosomal protein L20